VLGVQAGLISVANEVVVLVMARGAGTTSSPGLRWSSRRGLIHVGSWPEVAGSSSWSGMTDPHHRL
jgi:hypothetical protein